MEKTMEKMTVQDFAHLGGGVVAYVREMEGKEAKKFLGEGIAVPPKAKLFALFGADGTPISISGTREAAISSALEHELVPASVH